jgi:hypothetical protein
MLEAGVNKHFTVTAEHLAQLRARGGGGGFGFAGRSTMTQHERLVQQNRRDGFVVDDD